MSLVEADPLTTDSFGFRLKHILSNVSSSPYSIDERDQLELLAWDNINSQFAIADSEKFILGQTQALSAYIDEAKEAGDDEEGSERESLENALQDVAVIQKQGITNILFNSSGERLIIVVDHKDIYTYSTGTSSASNTALTHIITFEQPIRLIRASPYYSDFFVILTDNKTLNSLNIQTHELQEVAQGMMSFDWVTTTKSQDNTSIVVIGSNNDIKILDVISNGTTKSTLSSPLEDEEDGYQGTYITSFTADKILVMFQTSVEDEDEDPPETRAFIISLDETHDPIKEVTNILFPAPDSQRKLSFYSAQIHDWSSAPHKEFSNLQFILSSLSSDIVTLTPETFVEQMEDTDRAQLPLDEETYVDSLPIGCAVDITNKEPITAEISKYIEADTVDPLPRLVVLTNDNKLCMWEIFDIQAIKSSSLRKLTALQKNQKSLICSSVPSAPSVSQPASAAPLTKTEHKPAVDNPFATSNTPNPFMTNTRTVFGDSGSFLGNQKKAETKPAFQFEQNFASNLDRSSNVLDDDNNDDYDSENDAIPNSSDEDEEEQRENNNDLFKPKTSSVAGPTNFGGPVNTGAPSFSSNAFGNSSSSTGGATSFGFSMGDSKPMAFGTFSGSAPTTSTTVTGATESTAQMFGSTAFAASAAKASPFTNLGSNSGSSPFSSLGAKKDETPFGDLGANKESSPFGNLKSNNASSPFGNIGRKKEESPFGSLGSKKEDSPFASLGSNNASSPFAGTGSKKEESPISDFGAKKEESPFGNLGLKKEDSPFSGLGSKKEESPFASLGSNNASSPFTSIEAKKEVPSSANFAETKDDLTKSEPNKDTAEKKPSFGSSSFGKSQFSSLGTGLPQTSGSGFGGPSATAAVSPFAMIGNKTNQSPTDALKFDQSTEKTPEALSIESALDISEISANEPESDDSVEDLSRQESDNFDIVNSDEEAESEIEETGSDHSVAEEDQSINSPSVPNEVKAPADLAKESTPAIDEADIPSSPATVTSGKEVELPEPAAAENEDKKADDSEDDDEEGDEEIRKEIGSHERETEPETKTEVTEEEKIAALLALASTVKKFKGEDISKISEEEKDATLVALVKALDFDDDFLSGKLLQKMQLKDASVENDSAVSVAVETEEKKMVSCAMETEPRETNDASLEAFEQDELYLSKVNPPPKISPYLTVGTISFPQHPEGSVVEKKLQELYYYGEAQLNLLTKNVDNLGSFIDAHDMYPSRIPEDEVVFHTSTSLPFPEYWRLGECSTISAFIQDEVKAIQEFYIENEKLVTKVNELLKETTAENDEANKIANALETLKMWQNNKKALQKHAKLNFPQQALKTEVNTKLAKLDQDCKSIDIKILLFKLIIKLMTGNNEVQDAKQSALLWDLLISELHKMTASHYLIIQDMQSEIAALSESLKDDTDSPLSSRAETPDTVEVANRDLVVLSVSNLQRSMAANAEIGEALRSRTLNVSRKPPAVVHSRF